MTRKDFELIAKAIKCAAEFYGPETEAREHINRVATEIGRVCKMINPWFNFEKFYKACGIK